MSKNDRRKRAFYVVLICASILFGVLVIARTVEREIVDEEGNRFVGDTVDGQIHGEGRFDWADGSSYEGDFKNGEVHGEGTMQYVDGSKYSGTFNRGERHGYGVLTLEDGDVYVGTFIADKISGEGEWTSESKGESYRGLWKNGKRHGTGVLTWEDGAQYTGYFLNNQRYGFGEHISSDGQTYRGHFRSNLKHGDGILEVDQQTRRFQSWEQGQLIIDEEIKEVENCTLTVEESPWMFDGDECVDGLAHGTGRAVALDGSAYVNFGTFVLGNLVKGVVLPMTLPEEFDEP
ncbi:MAG: hypothetical protein F4227_02175 [Gammaproteobacteria bacterium]|nr:hypothetical protein [Gammaproteobacteria bacterium]MYF01807.1 hypothetical protein [Gammaproteobacteria bacterium]MYI76447.1 hypothetical protein [Gammaproteobacteria bacterium]